MTHPDIEDNRRVILTWARESMPAEYATLLESLIDEAERGDQVTGLLLTGSLARRDALPGTDIDIRWVVPTADPHSFERGFRDGILLEQTVTSEAAATAQLAQQPMHVYAYLDGVILYDQNGSLQRLHDQAVAVFSDYRTPLEAKQQLAAALMHPEDKIRIGLRSGDLLKATYSLATTSWQLIEGLWAANDRPLPPHSSVRPHLRDLDGPEDIEALFARLFLADPQERAETALDLLGWTRDRLADQGADR